MTPHKALWVTSVAHNSLQVEDYNLQAYNFLLENSFIEFSIYQIMAPPCQAIVGRSVSSSLCVYQQFEHYLGPL